MAEETPLLLPTVGSSDVVSCEEPNEGQPVLEQNGGADPESQEVAPSQGSEVLELVVTSHSLGTDAAEEPEGPWPGLRAQLEEHGEQLEGLRRTFDDKFALDRHKEKQIDRLHGELQEYKRGLLAKAQRPLLSGMVRLHGSFERTGELLAEDEAETLPRGRALEILEGFRDDVEILLEDQGVHLFRVAEPIFDPLRQAVLRGIPTDDEAEWNRVARRVRPGFEQEGKVLQKERVDVYCRSPKPMITRRNP